WGNNLNGQLGVDGHERLTPVKVKGLPRIIHVAAGMFHSLAVDATGHVWVWGQNSHGQLGDGTRTTRLVPMLLAGLDQVMNVSAGRSHTLALLSNGDVMSWGNNAFGQLGSRRGGGDRTPRGRGIVELSLGYEPPAGGAGFGPDVLRPVAGPAVHR